MWIAGYFFGQEAIQRSEISNQISGLMGAEAAKSVEGMVSGALIDKENITMKIV